MACRGVAWRGRTHLLDARAWRAAPRRGLAWRGVDWHVVRSPVWAHRVTTIMENLENQESTWNFDSVSKISKTTGKCQFFVYFLENSNLFPIKPFRVVPNAQSPFTLRQSATEQLRCLFNKIISHYTVGLLKTVFKTEVGTMYLNQYCKRCLF